MPKHIIDDAVISFDGEDSDEENSDEESIAKNICLSWKGSYNNVFFEEVTSGISLLKSCLYQMILIKNRLIICLKHGLFLRIIVRV